MAFSTLATNGVWPRVSIVPTTTMPTAITTIERGKKEFRIVFIGHRAEKMSDEIFAEGRNW
jgi:hypothetical protein